MAKGTAPHDPAASRSRRALSVVTLVLGILAVPAGYTLLVPVAAIIVGMIARDREPYARALSGWGIGLGVVGLVIGALLVIVLGVSPFGIQGFEVLFDWTP